MNTNTIRFSENELKSFFINGMGRASETRSKLVYTLELTANIIVGK